MSDLYEGVRSVKQQLAAKDAEIARLKERVEWQPIETTPKDGSAFLARFNKETLEREDYSRSAECAVVRFQRASDSGNPDWEIYSLAGPFGVGLSASMFDGWMPLPDPSLIAQSNKEG